ncbi:MAG: hypothetical protein NVSMB2_16460 [Chloroflexota bacterium]
MPVGKHGAMLVGVNTQARALDGRALSRVEVAFWALALALYGATTWWYVVRPLAGRWGDALLGTALFRPDPILNAAILEWGWIALRHFPLRLLDWPAGYPLTNSLAGTENLLGWQVLYMPLRALGVSTVGAYNTLLVASLVLSGLAMTAFARRLGVNRGGALVAGFVFEFLPFHLSQLIHIQTMSIAWAPLALLFADRVLAEGRRRDVIGLAATVLITVASGMYIGIFLVCAIALYAGACHVARRYQLTGSSAAKLASGVGVALLVLSPVLAVYIGFALGPGYAHPTAGIVGEALADFVRPAFWQVTWAAVSSTLPGSFLTAAFPGVAAVGLGLFGALAARTERDTRTLTRVAAIVAGVTLLLSLGPVLKLTEQRPIHLGSYEVPAPGLVFVLVSAIRYPMRMALFSAIFGALVCGAGVQFVSRGRSPLVQSVCVALALAFLFVEYRPSTDLSAASMSLAAPQTLAEALHGDPDQGALVELPWIDDAGLGDATFMALDVYAATGHQRRTVAYYAGVRPGEIDRLQQAAVALPNDVDRQLLVAAGVSRLVIRTSWLSAEHASELLERLDAAGYPRVITTSDTVVYALT